MIYNVDNRNENKNLSGFRVQMWQMDLSYTIFSKFVCNTWQV